MSDMLELVRPNLVRLVNDGRPAEALGLECGYRFHFLDGTWTWSDVVDWMEDSREIITARPDQFVMHLGMNNFRTSVFILMHRNGYLDCPEEPEELSQQIAWLLDGSHHTVSCYYDDWVEIIDQHRVLTDGPGAEWLKTAPEIVKVYRGYDAEEGRKLGICWSIDSEVAIRFSAGTQGKKHEKPSVVGAKVQRKDIAGALFGREDQVLIIDEDAIEIIGDMTI